MIEFEVPRDEKPALKLEVPTHDEIEGIIRDIIRDHEGEELIERLTEFCLLNIVEVIFTQDKSPVPLQRLGEKRLETVQKLIAPDAKTENPD